MSVIFLIFIYLLAGLLTGLIYKKVFPWRGITNLTAFLVIGGVSAVFCGLITLMMVGYAYPNSYIGVFETQIINEAQSGNSPRDFTNTVFWLPIAVAVFGALITTTVYRLIVRLRLPE
jgi:hypothetical protein